VLFAGGPHKKLALVRNQLNEFMQLDVSLRLFSFLFELHVGVSRRMCFTGRSDLFLPLALSLLFNLFLLASTSVAGGGAVREANLGSRER
jgi:hypothetical protein